MVPYNFVVCCCFAWALRCWACSARYCLLCVDGVAVVGLLMVGVICLDLAGYGLGLGLVLFGFRCLVLL